VYKPLLVAGFLRFATWAPFGRLRRSAILVTLC